MNKDIQIFLSAAIFKSLPQKLAITAEFDILSNGKIKFFEKLVTLSFVVLRQKGTCQKIIEACKLGLLGLELLKMAV